MTSPAEVVDALETLAARRADYQLYGNYYAGIHDTKFASDAWRDTFAKLMRNLNYNRCASVVDATSDRLQITGWEIDGAKGDEAAPHVDAQNEWDRCGGDYLQGLVHVEALRAGDAYLIVWPHQERPEEPVWRMQRGDSCLVVTDDESAEPIAGIKVWRVSRGADAGRWRLTIYTPEVISRWISRKESERKIPLKAEAWAPFAEAGEHDDANPYGRLPMVHFPNNPQYQGECGVSELRDVVPLQDGLNYSIWQEMVAGEFTAWPMRWATGVEPTLDPMTGVEVETIRQGIDRWIEIGNELAKVGQLPGADLTPYIAIQDSWDAKISRVSHVPVHWLQGVSGQVSGETLKVAESPFAGKLTDRQRGFSRSWKDAMAMAMVIRGHDGEGSAKPIWAPVSPRSDAEKWTIALQQKAAGIPDEQIWREAGYSEDQIRLFRRLNERAARREAELTATVFARGERDTLVNEDNEDAESAA